MLHRVFFTISLHKRIKQSASTLKYHTANIKLLRAGLIYFSTILAVELVTGSVCFYTEILEEEKDTE